MPALTRRPLGKSNENLTTKTPPSSPRTQRKTPASNTKSTPNYDDVDSSINTEDDNEYVHESEDINNSSKKRQVKAKGALTGKGNIYPKLDPNPDVSGGGYEMNDESPVKTNRRNFRGKDENSPKTRRGKTEGNRRNSPREEVNDRRPTTDKTQSESGLNMMTLVVVLLVVVIAVFMYLNIDKLIPRDEPKINKPKIDHFKLFKKDYEFLRKQFPEQSERFWKVIGAPIRRVLNEDEPSYPAIVLLGVPHSQPHMGSCLTKKIVQNINTIQRLSGDFYIDTGALDSSTPGKTRLDLDQKMHTALNSSRTVILDHIELLPGEAALLLHAFCDGDNAPYKKAVIFLVLHLSSRFSEVDRIQEGDVEQILVNMWESDLGEDEMPALQSRIANNIAVMKPEKKAVCT